jgi:PAS domain S-box-containing protein
MTDSVSEVQGIFEELSAGLDCLRSGFALFDESDQLVYCNQHFRFLYTSLRDLNEIIGVGYRELLEILVDGGEFAGAEVINDPESWINRRLSEHRKERAITLERLADGRWIEVKERKTKNGGVIGIWTDVTDSRRYLAHLESAMDCIADGFAIWDQAGRLYRFNDRVAERYGGPDHSVKIGDKFEDVLANVAPMVKLKDDEQTEDWLAYMLAGRNLPERTVDVEFTDDRHFILSERRTREGGVVSALTDVTELKQKERDLVFRGQSLELAISELEMVNDSLERQGFELAGMAEQIDAAHTELKIKRQSLAIAEARQRAILETMADGLVVLDDRGYVETLNHNAEKMLGVDAGEALGRPLVEFVQIEDGDQLIGDIPAYLNVLREVEEDHRGEFVIRTRNGSSLSVEVAISEARAESQRYMVITLRDVSDRKAAEKALMESYDTLERRVLERTQALTGEIRQREDTEQALILAKKEAELANWAKSQFLANMSHELRTPLNCVIGFSDMLSHQYFGPIGNERYVEYANDIRMSGNHLLGVIDDILDVSKIELGEFVLEEQDIQVSEIIEACETMIEDKARLGEISIKRVIEDGVTGLHGDERRIKQALLNLVSNAVKFTNPGGYVMVEARLDELGGVNLIVIDTGVGIAMKDIDRILQPFSQVADSHTRGYEGTGLGLSIAKSLIELHGGVLDIESAVNMGTRVALIFPPSRTQP